MARPSQPATRRSGYTLLEMIVVLGVLAALAALSWPMLRGVLNKSRVQEAAKQVGAILGRARLTAIETGAVQQFRFQPGGQQFDISPYQGPQTDAATADQVNQANLAVPDDPNASTPGTPIDDGILPDDVTRFQLPDGIAFFVPDTSSSTSPDDVNAQPQDDSGWAPPILFFPSGRSSNARIRLLGQQDLYVDLTLRGLTGTVAVTGVQQQQETSP
jgi:prepilin-type N-terminal cleavage/methylation domain-containing protein